MSGSVLGIDTSNYTTSVALFDIKHKRVSTASKLLPVGRGQLGLRQSEAVFHHVKALPDIIGGAVSDIGSDIKAVAVSTRPRDAEGSYMPCFLAGSSTAHSIANILSVPVFEFSHQCGHIAAAAYGAGRVDLLDGEFIAFHLSGGTTEGLLVKPDDDKIISVSLVSETLDLNAGQAVDRVGNLLGLDFPAGIELEKLALKGVSPRRVKPSIKDGNCCLSGIVNICEDLLSAGESKENVARCCIDFILDTLCLMVEAVLSKYGDLPLLFAGGVMSNSIIRSAVTGRFGSYFAPPEFSRDNAVGISLLGSMMYDR